MKLVSARIQGAGRLVDTLIRTDPKLVAVVGPNEAGKSTLLRALAFTDSDEEWPAAQRSRAREVGEDVQVVSLDFLLDEEDLIAIEDIDLLQKPTSLRIARTASGKRIKTCTPTPVKGRNSLRASVKALRATIKPSNPASTLPISERSRKSLASLTKRWESVVASDSFPESIDNELTDLTRLAYLELSDNQAFVDVASALEGILDWLDAESPVNEVCNRLWQLTPDFVLFNDQDRNLRSSYVLDQKLVAQTPPALRHLARLAKFDIADLVRMVENGQIAQRNTLRNRANANLKEAFQEGWNQARLTVELNVEADVLRIGILEDEIYSSEFSDRSAGLRAFVALTAFLADRESKRPPILLIDEAENHLHIDAQADLVNMLSTQKAAAKVIYTTHSPACLPFDLGIGIRAVVPDSQEKSHVENNFWRARVGTPAGTHSALMFSMGATAAAFTPARCVLVAEGSSDMILLPSLIRAATGLERLPYQVTAGLSELAPEFYPELDFEAAKVAFLVDGDDGGEALKRELTDSLPASLTFSLAVPGVENLLDPHQYRLAFVSATNRANNSSADNAPELQNPDNCPWARLLEDWAASLDLTPPSKGVVASAIIEQHPIPLGSHAKQDLRTLHRDICSAFGIK